MHLMTGIAITTAVIIALTQIIICTTGVIMVITGLLMITMVEMWFTTTTT